MRVITKSKGTSVKLLIECTKRLEKERKRRGVKFTTPLIEEAILAHYK